MVDVLPFILAAVKNEQEEEHLDIIFVNERLIFQEKYLIKWLYRSKFLKQQKFSYQKFSEKYQSLPE